MGVVLLSGCSAPGSLPEFERDRTTADEIPISLESTDLNADSSRRAGQDSAGATYYLVRSNDDQAPCVVVVPAEGE